MRHIEGTFEGPRGLAVGYRGWLPSEAPAALVIIVHGLGEHAGRYGNVVHRLVPRGIALFGHDHPGHGRSQGRRKHVERFADFDEALSTFRAMVRGWHPDPPLFLLGHSLGGLIAAHHLIDHQDGMRGAILSGPAVAIEDATSPLTVLAARLASQLIPTAGVHALDATGISKDPDVVAAYLADPLVSRVKTSARLAAAMLRASRRVSEHAGAIELPLLTVQGADDRLVPASGVRRVFDRFGSRDKTLRVYDGVHHEVFNEPERAAVLDDLQGWLEARI